MLVDRIDNALKKFGDKCIKRSDKTVDVQNVVTTSSEYHVFCKRELIIFNPVTQSTKLVVAFVTILKVNNIVL